MSKYNATLGYDRAVVGGPIKFTNKNTQAARQYFGRTIVVSDTLGYSAVISTNLVAADSLIFVTPEIVTSGTMTFGGAQVFDIATKSPGGFFKLQSFVSPGSAFIAGSAFVGWVIFNAKE
jgi:hypothetical protein